MRQTGKYVLAMLVGVVITLLAVAGLAAVVNAATPPSPDPESLVSALRSGEITLGSDESSALYESFPIVDFQDETATGTYNIRFFYYRGEFVVLYALDGKLFAAQRAIGMTTQSHVEWFFVDADIMQRYLDDVVPESVGP